MPDVYANIADADVTVQQRLADVMDVRAADSQQAAIRDAFLAAIPLPPNAHVLEIGCGSGVVVHAITTRAGIGEVVGVDPSAVFLARARERMAAFDNVRFIEGDGRALPLDDNSFDAVVMYTLLTHVPEAHKALAEAYRVLKPGGRLAVFDGDYATTTVALNDIDPLESCIDAAMAALVTDRWLARRLPSLIRAAQFVEPSTASYGYVGIDNPDYPFSIVDRGADALAAAGNIGADLAAALKAEARRRAEASVFFGHIAYFSVIARKPA